MRKKTLGHYYILLRRKIIRPILKNERLSYFLSKHCVKTFLSMFYENWVGRMLNFSHPEDVNQLLMRLSIDAYEDPAQHSLRVRCADKYLVREYVASKGLDDILIPSYGAYGNFDEIDFDKLPNRFVIQTNFGCGQIWICKDKKAADLTVWRKQFDDWMAIEDFGWKTGEWQYNEIPHKLVVTKYLDGLGSTPVIDYKFHCFNGSIYGCLVVYDRVLSGVHSMQLDHYNSEWNRTDSIIESYHPKRRQIDKPNCYEQMIEIAKSLSKDFPYCRVDLYEVEGKVYFGELTFTPQGNVMSYYTGEALADMLHYYQSTQI